MPDFDLNEPLLREVQRYIQAHPEELDMETPILLSSNCGTTACIAGTIALLDKKEEIDELLEKGEFLIPTEDKESKIIPWNLTQARGVGVEQLAAKALGLKTHTKYGVYEVALFYTRLWPEDLQTRFTEAKDKKEKASIACSVIEYYMNNPSQILIAGDDYN